MEDPVSITLDTFEALASAMPRELDDNAGRQAAEAFLMRTGRPMPRVVVLCGDPRDADESLAIRCRQLSELGGDVIGVAGAAVVRNARGLFPEGEFREGDFRRLPVDRNAFDGVWTGRLLAHIPRAEVHESMRSVHDALRPGGLLYARIAVGENEGRDDWGVYRREWRPEDLAEALGTLNFDLLETTGEPGDAAMLFRREY